MRCARTYGDRDCQVVWIEPRMNLLLVYVSPGVMRMHASPAQFSLLVLLSLL